MDLKPNSAITSFRVMSANSSIVIPLKRGEAKRKVEKPLPRGLHANDLKKVNRYR